MTEPANAVMEKAGEIFGKKYFGVPFPVILIGVAGAAYVVRRMIKGNEEAKVAAPATEGYAMDVSGNKFASAYTGQAGGVPFGSGSLTSAAVSGVSAITPATEMNNDGWVRRATEKLNLLGQWNVMDIQAALQAYISGKQLDQRQAAIVQQATKVEGIAPVNVTPGGVTQSSSSVVRIISPANSPVAFAEYADGSVKPFNSMAELESIAANNTALQYNDGTPKIVVLQQDDPTWNRADYSPWGGQEAFKQSVIAYQQGDSNWTPYWATPSYIYSHNTATTRGSGTING